MNSFKQFVYKYKIIFIAVSLVVFTILVFAISVNIGSQKEKKETMQKQHQDYGDKQMQSSIQAEWPALWGAPDNRNKCEKNESVRFSALPISLEDILYIQPIGELREGHIVPGDHGGFDYKTSPTSTPVKIYSPADGFLVGVEKHPYTPPPGYPAMKHYHIYIEHSCTLFTGFVHLTEFSSQLLAENPQLKTLNEDTSGQFKNAAFRIPVKAGQQIGTAWSFGLLGWVTVDLAHANKGYLNPQSYKGENWRIHSVSGFDYFTESLKTQIMAKNPRTQEPRGGKIDFDIVGKLVGNWFEKGTNGLSGDSKSKQKQCGNFPCPYWDGHIAFVYDYIDPSQLRISIGHDWGLSGRTPFGVKGNSSDFRDVGIEDELVKYELVSLKDISREKGYDANSPLITINNEAQILGTLLVQVLDNNSIKVEISPGKTKEQASGFTSNAIIYER